MKWYWAILLTIALFAGMTVVLQIGGAEAASFIHLVLAIFGVWAAGKSGSVAIMDSRHKKKAWIGLSVGLPLFLGGCALVFTYVRGPMAAALLTSTPAMVAYAMVSVSVPFYLWGCAALAKAKGYSTAILFT